MNGWFGSVWIVPVVLVAPVEEIRIVAQVVVVHSGGHRG